MNLIAFMKIYAVPTLLFTSYYVKETLNDKDFCSYFFDKSEKRFVAVLIGTSRGLIWPYTLMYEYRHRQK